MSFSQAILKGTTVQDARRIIATSTEEAGDISKLVQTYEGNTPTSAELAGLEQWVSNGLSLQQLASLIADLPSNLALQAISAASAPQPFSAAIIVAIPNSDVEIPTGTPPSNGTDQATVVFAVGGGTYEVGNSVASPTDSSTTGSEHVALPDGSTAALNDPVTIYVVPNSSNMGESTLIDVPAGEAGTSVINVATGTDTTLEITSESSGPLSLSPVDSNLMIKADQPGDIIVPNAASNILVEGTPIAFLSELNPIANMPATFISLDRNGGVLLRDTAIKLNDEIIAAPTEGVTIDVTDFDAATTASFLYEPILPELAIQDHSRFTQVFFSHAFQPASVHVVPDSSGGAEVILAMGAS